MTAVVIKPQWSGATVAVLASGMGLRSEIVDWLPSSTKIIAVNNQALDCARHADIIWASDAKWWNHYGSAVAELPGRKMGIAGGYQPAWVETVVKSMLPFDLRPTHLSTGLNSGYAAVCLAARMGATRIQLFGFDMREVSGRRRRFDYPPGLDSASKFKDWIAKFHELAPILKAAGVQVENHTPGSALRCFPIGLDFLNRQAG